MPTTSNYLCGCGRFMRPKTNSVTVEEVTEDGQPYKLWDADLYKCPECGVEIIAGFGRGPLAEHYQPDYAEQRARLAPVYVVGRCAEARAAAEVEAHHTCDRCGAPCLRTRTYIDMAYVADWKGDGSIQPPRTASVLVSISLKLPDMGEVSPDVCASCLSDILLSFIASTEPKRAIAEQVRA